jgi:cytosine/adenosine deaminase-related metal-dependent hydrolase
MNEGLLLLTGLAVADADGVRAAGHDAALLLRESDQGELPVLLALGADAWAHPLALVARRIDRPRSVLLPGLVNAHTHLDLTHLGPRPYDPADGFMSWVDVIRAGRCVDSAEIDASVTTGIALSRRGGVVAVGDIAGAPRGMAALTPWRVLASSPMLGVSFLEFFGIGKGSERGFASIERALSEAETVSTEPARARLGLQPHAPNTVSLANYQRAVHLARERRMRLSTHLAETWEEREFVAHARGPQREFLERLGLWDDSMLEEIGAGRHPVEHLAPVLAEAPFLAAHANDADAAAIGTLARTGTTVVYCPRASEYFGAPARFGPHRYREMLAAGVRVALGTDSIVNLDTPGRISVLDEARLLHRRDGTDPRLLLAMSTTHGAAALGMPEEWFAFRRAGERARVAGVVGVEVAVGAPDAGVLERVLEGGEIELLVSRQG